MLLQQTAQCESLPCLRYVVECCVVSDDVVLQLSQKYAVVWHDHVYGVLFLFLCEQVISASCGVPPSNSAKTECECLGSKISFS